MSGHTQGPWTQSKIVPTAVDDALNFIVDCRVIDDDIETAIANARLIAAAPDMYLALVMLTDTIAFQFARKVEKDLILAAIAKATGEVT